MTLANEAAYLYVYAKDLVKLKQELHELKEDGDKFTQKYHQAKTHEDREKYRKKYHHIVEKSKKVTEKHHHVLTMLRRHQIAFANALQKEHKV